jgi:hypothetical protein
MPSAEGTKARNPTKDHRFICGSYFFEIRAFVFWWQRAQAYFTFIEFERIAVNK